MYKYLLKAKEPTDFECYRVCSVECKENLTEKDVLSLCQRTHPQYNFVECKQLTKDRHICKYCGWVAEGKDEDLLCQECRYDFGHAFYSEL